MSIFIYSDNISINNTKKLKRLMRKIEKIKCKYYATDRWKVYPKVIFEGQIVQSKKETSRIESENSRIRYYIARFHRRTHCFKITALSYSQFIF